MPCAARDGAECLADDIWPHVQSPTWVARDSSTQPSDHLALSTFCPAHDDGKRSLQISVGRHKRIIWNCHAGCGELAVRHALITRRGVRPTCLPVSAGESNDLIERLLAITGDGELSHAHARLLTMELLTSGKGGLPRGGELDLLASGCSVSRAEAYRALGKSGRPK
jgi:hypothetical protein